jgi:hypothetical protein
MAAWIYDAEIQEWRLVLASPSVDEKGPLSVYRRIGDVLTREGLQPLDLDRIVVVGAADSSVKDLANLASRGEALGVRLGKSNVAGHQVEEGYLYQPEAVRYEEDVFAAFQRVVSPRAVMRRAPATRDVGFDLLIDDGINAVAIVVKPNIGWPWKGAGRQESFWRRIRNQAQWLTPDSWPRAWLLVTSHLPDPDLSSSPEATLQPKLQIIRWRSPQDDRLLREAMAQVGLASD